MTICHQDYLLTNQQRFTPYLESTQKCVEFFYVAVVVVNGAVMIKHEAKGIMRRHGFVPLLLFDPLCHRAGEQGAVRFTARPVATALTPAQCVENAAVEIDAPRICNMDMLFTGFIAVCN